MCFSSCVVFISTTLGIVGSYYLVKGILSASIQFIYDQTGAQTRGIGNFVFAKGAITQKAQTIYGFTLLLLAFVFQFIALLLKDSKFDIATALPKSWFALMLVGVVIIAVLIINNLIRRREKIDGLNYVKLVFKDRIYDETILDKVDNKFCEQIADLLCLDKQYISDLETLKVIIKDKIQT